jgi:two-component system OmpR family response regulator
MLVLFKKYILLSCPALFFIEKSMPTQRKILIIDDEHDFCDLIVLMLHGELYHVDCAYNLKEASDFLKTANPGIVLLDSNLPDGTGLEFFRKNKADFENAKIILMTADPSPDTKKQAQDAGILFLEKPFGIKKIREAIRGMD